MITISFVAEGNCFPFTLSLKINYILHFLFQDSLLLGKIHLSLLKLLLVDVETELQRGSFSTLSISCKFLALLQSVCGAIYFFLGILPFERQVLTFSLIFFLGGEPNSYS